MILSTGIAFGDSCTWRRAWWGGVGSLVTGGIAAECNPVWGGRPWRALQTPTQPLAIFCLSLHGGQSGHSMGLMQDPPCQPQHFVLLSPPPRMSVPLSASQAPTIPTRLSSKEPSGIAPRPRAAPLLLAALITNHPAPEPLVSRASLSPGLGSSAGVSLVVPLSPL